MLRISPPKCVPTPQKFNCCKEGGEAKETLVTTNTTTTKVAKLKILECMSEVTLSKGKKKKKKLDLDYYSKQQ